jgi:hypothetical protein
MPLQRAVELDALANQPFAVVDEQPHVQLRSVQLRGRERLEPLLQRGAGDVERVDQVRLAAPTGALAGLRGQVRRDPQHPLAALDQKPLERPGHVPTVLKRPHTVIPEAARPLHQRAKPAPVDRNGLLAEQLAGCRCDRRDGVRSLVSVRAEHDHALVLLHRQRRTPGGHGLLEALPRIYQVTPEVPDRRRATKHKQVRP